MQSTPPKPPRGPVEPWLLLWCQLFHRELWNGSDEWGPVRLHSLGGLESIQLSVTLPALTVMNTMQAADNTPIRYKIKKKEMDGKRCVSHPSMLHSSTLPLEDLSGEEMMKPVYTVMCKRRSSIRELHPVRLSIKQPKHQHFFFYFFNKVVSGPHLLQTCILTGLPHAHCLQSSSMTLLLCQGHGIPVNQRSI